MKLFIVVVIFIFSLQSLTRADDIKDFEIEGMSIGDSLLDFMSKDEIKNNTLQYFSDKRKYFITAYYNNLDNYDQVELYIKTGDKNYTIETILAGIFIEKLNDCLEKKKEVANYLDKVFPNIKKVTGSKKHEADKKGKSFQYIDQYVLKFPTHVRVECTEFSDEMINSGMGTNSLNVVAMTDNVYEWISSGYK